MVYRSNDYTDLMNKIGYKFKDTEYLDVAFTHKSYSNECKIPDIHSYERCEFLGDAILEFLTSRELYKRYPDMPEGDLTKLRASLVCEMSLSKISRELGFGAYLYLSKGEELTGGRDRNSILCDLFESVLGAIYQDGGLRAAAKFVNKFLLSDIDGHSVFYDAKSTLQEYSQRMNIPLKYELVKESGPDHNKTYTVSVVLGGTRYATAEGHTIKSAEQLAAHDTITELNDKDID